MSEPDREITLETMAALLESDLRHGEDYYSFPVRMHPDQCREWIHRLREIRDYIAALERENAELRQRVES